MKYRPELDPVLKQINFNILPNEKVGIVGRTGAGNGLLTYVYICIIIPCCHYVEQKSCNKYILNKAIDQCFFASSIQPIYVSNSAKYYAMQTMWIQLKGFFLSKAKICY